ncbi:GYD domain-containing protein [Saccharomonospora sp. NPDC046836]|uniref:GYD domain-containing protein n=1 Tax=Saccharomonospora sp. NPDC046836 TaxID=3156921 RepID=UPI003406F3B6
MAKYAVFFSYTPESWARMIANPSDRMAAVKASTESVGGSVETMYFMFGERDGFVVVDLPDSEAAAAMSVAVSSTGAFRSVQTHELIAPAHLPQVLERARTTAASYRPPGT